jgi:hypothetical protein
MPDLSGIFGGWWPWVWALSMGVGSGMLANLLYVFVIWTGSLRNSEQRQAWLEIQESLVILSLFPWFLFFYLSILALGLWDRGKVRG